MSNDTDSFFKWAYYVVMAYPRVKKDDTAAQGAYENLRKTEITCYIEMRRAEKAAESNITQDGVLEEVSGILQI